MVNQYPKRDPEPLPEEPEHCVNCDRWEPAWVYMGRWGGEVWWECLACNKLTKEPLAG